MKSAGQDLHRAGAGFVRPSLRSDCLLFRRASGQQLPPFSVGPIVIAFELIGCLTRQANKSRAQRLRGLVLIIFHRDLELLRKQLQQCPRLVHGFFEVKVRMGLGQFGSEFIVPKLRCPFSAGDVVPARAFNELLKGQAAPFDGELEALQLLLAEVHRGKKFAGGFMEHHKLPAVVLRGFAPRLAGRGDAVEGQKLGRRALLTVRLEPRARRVKCDLSQVHAVDACPLLIQFQALDEQPPGQVPVQRLVIRPAQWLAGLHIPGFRSRVRFLDSGCWSKDGGQAGGETNMPPAS